MGRRVAIALWLVMGVAVAAALIAARRTADIVPVETPIVLPGRTAAAPPVVPPPPAVPDHAERLPGMTFTVDTTWAGGPQPRRESHRVTRTHDRVSLVLDGGRIEWLFVRNATYRDRAAGYLVDHARRTIRIVDESPLRDVFGIRGWLDVLTHRFDVAALARLRPTRDETHAGGAAFERYVADDATADGIVEVWWNDEWLLPLSVQARTAGTVVTSTVMNVSLSVDTAVLSDPDVRYPAYEQVDLAEARDH